MTKENIMEKIDNLDKRQLLLLQGQDIWSHIQNDEELLRYYQLSLELKTAPLPVDLWDRFQEKVESNKKKTINLIRWSGAAMAASLLITAGLILGLPQPKRTYVYNFNNSNSEIDEYSTILNNFEDTDITAVDYVYQIASSY